MPSSVLLNTSPLCPVSFHLFFQSSQGFIHDHTVNSFLLLSREPQLWTIFSHSVHIMQFTSSAISFYLIFIWIKAQLKGITDLFFPIESSLFFSSTPLHACGSSTPGEPDPQVHHLRQPPASVFVFFVCVCHEKHLLLEKELLFLPQPWGHCLCFWVKLLTIGWIDIKYDTDIYVYFSMNGVTCPLIGHRHLNPVYI